MSFNQSKSDKSEAVYRKSNNAQGGHSRVNPTPVNSTEANSAPAARTILNGTHVQSQLHGAPDAPVTTKPSESLAAQRSSRVVPKAPTSQPPPTLSSDSAAPTTPAKGDASKAFPFQLGSISPGFMNGMAITAHTSSAPPNIDEQKRDQVLHNSFRSVPSGPTPPVPKQQQPPRKDAGLTHQSNAGETHIGTKGRKDPQVSASTPAGLIQKPAIVSVTGITMAMPYHQSQAPLQFGGPNPHIQSQSMSTASLQMPVPIPIPIGNAAQVQQQVFVPGLQSHPMHHQGIMHQGQNMSFTPPMGHQLSHQLGNMGIGIIPQYPQQQGGKFATPRKTTTVKITHPETHEELRLDKKADVYSDGGISGVRSHPNMPSQSQPVQSLAASHPMNYYSSSFNNSSRYYPPPSSLPPTSSQITPNSQPPRFSYPVNHGPQNLGSADLSEITSIHVKDSSVNAGSDSLSLPVSGNKDRQTLGANTVKTKSKGNKKRKEILQKADTTSLPVSGNKDRQTLEANKVKTTSKGKKKRKEILQKADAARSTSDLYNAYKGPEEKKEDVLSSESMENDSTSGSLKQLTADAAQPGAVASEKCGESKAEPDDWEDVADMSTPKVEVADKSKQVSGESGGTAKKYSRDFLLKFSEQCTDLPEGFDISTDIAGASMSTNISSVHVSERDSHPSPGRIVDRPGAMSRMDRRGKKKRKEILQKADAASLPVSGNKDIQTLEANKVKTTSKGKKKRKEILQKADAARSTSNLYNAYKGPEEKKEAVLSSESMENDSTSGSLKQLTADAAQPGAVASEKCGESKAEPDDWEDVADMSTPKVEVADKSKQVSGKSGGTSRDFLLKFSEQCTDLPEGFDISTDIAGALMSTNISSVHVSECDSHPSPGRIVDRPGGMSRMDRRGKKKRKEILQKADAASLPVSGNKDRQTLEANKVRTASKGKKKRKEILQKADAARSTSDLYNAYKGPEEKKEAVLSSESMENDSTSGSLKQLTVDAAQPGAVASEKCGESKAEPDDWEDVADMSTPKVEVADKSKQVSGESGGTAKKFLLKFSEQCTDLPEGFDISTDIAGALMSANISSVHVSERDSHPSPGRIVDRPGGMSQMDRRGSGMNEEDRWNKVSGVFHYGRVLDGIGGNAGFRAGHSGNFGDLRNPCSLTSLQYSGGILSGPMQSMGNQGGMQRNSPDGGWQHSASFQQRGLIPSPTPPQTPLQMMHKAEKKYEVGKIPYVEQAKQRQLKAILSKLTPLNFERLFEQVKSVNIDNAITLTGVVSQIFEKALIEPTFCEMYANFCSHLAFELPDFSEDNEKITFKRLLLNKCQEEFERGEREQADEGEVKQSDAEREERRVKAKRRMLGNIRLIGELYKKRMLTERIMHECIKKLLGQYQDPDEEDIEALCKLMSTIGEMIDHPKAKVHIDAYFERMTVLSNNMNLSSSVRFMLKDAIALRKNKWQ